MKKFIFIFIISTIISSFPLFPVVADSKTAKDVVSDLFGEIKTGILEKDKEKIFGAFSDNLQVNDPSFLKEQDEALNQLFEMNPDEIKYSFEIKKIIEKVINKRDVIIALIYTKVGTEEHFEDLTAWYYIDDDKFEIYKIEIIDDDEDDDSGNSQTGMSSIHKYSGKLPKNSPPESKMDPSHRGMTSPNNEHGFGPPGDNDKNEMPSEFANDKTQNQTIPEGISDTPKPRDPKIDYGGY